MTNETEIKAPEKTSRWTDEERERTDVPPPPLEAPPPPPPWLPAFQRDTLIQHNGWWARIAGYGQNDEGEIGCFVVPQKPTRGAVKRGAVRGL